MGLQRTIIGRLRRIMLEILLTVLGANIFLMEAIITTPKLFGTMSVVLEVISGLVIFLTVIN